MILGSKPLAEMTQEEMEAAIVELRSAREALREAAIKDKAEGRKPRAPRVEKEVNPFQKDILAILKGED